MITNYYCFLSLKAIFYQAHMEFKATFTWDWTGTVLNRTGSASVYTGPFRNRSGTDPKLDLSKTRSSFGTVSEGFQNGPV